MVSGMALDAVDGIEVQGLGGCDGERIGSPQKSYSCLECSMRRIP